MAAELRLTRDLFLWSMSVVYLFAFASLFVQIPGLYGDKGILPARLVIQNEAESFYDLVTNQPTLLRLLPKVGLDVKTGMDFLSLGGIVVSFVAMVSHDYRNSVVFALLWTFYLSLYQVGQTFTCSQWDLLLLEAGFLAVIVAPLNLFGFHDVTERRVHDRITFWLIRWLLFRVTFASGIVKLLSKSTSWWSLSAVKHHYETQLLPTPMAWVFHQFPDWWHLIVAAALLIVEILVPLFFFSPSKKQQRFALYCEIAYALLMMLTGNFGFYPLLILTLSLSLTDDNFISDWIFHPTETVKDHPKSTGSRSGWFTTLESVFIIVSSAGLMFAVFMSFTFHFQMSPLNLKPEIAFSPEDLDSYISYLLPLTIGIGAVSLVWHIATAVVQLLSDKRRLMNEKLIDLAGCLVFGLIAALLFAMSLVPHVAVQKDGGSVLPERLQEAYKWTSQNYRLVNPYNLYLKSTDEDDGRLEIVIEGSNKLHGVWKEYCLLYKPSTLNGKLPVVAPHMPRLDSQMWFAARGRYKQNPWFLNFVFRLLRNQEEVLELLDDSPFPNGAPKYVRATLFKYRFATRSTKSDKFTASDWWVREPVREYVPPLSLDEPSFVSYLMEAGIYYLDDEEHDAAQETHNFLYEVLETIRSRLGQGSGNIACILLLVAGFILTLVDPNCIKLPTAEERLANGFSSHGLCG